jgi:hypothetical protein
MANQDDSFIREVNEELRSDRMKDAWRRYGKILIAAAVILVIGTAGWRGYEYWQSREAAKSGDVFLTALNQIEAGNLDAAEQTLAQLEQEGHGSYPVLAQLRAATLLSEAGDTAAAIPAPMSRFPQRSRNCRMTAIRSASPHAKYSDCRPIG